MQAPATSEQIHERLRKCGLLTPQQLEAVIQDTLFDDTPAQILNRLVADGTLTHYQARKISEGKYRGFVLGPYVIRDRLGGGGMGQVFLAEHAAMRRHVALKVLSLGSGNDTVARERFFREARVAAGLDHPNIVRVFDLRREDALCYLVMEFIDGENLQHVVARHGPIDPLRAAEYARQVALGLQHAHEFGLVHRDIKPGNLLLAPDGTVKIIDLGLVRADDEADSQLTSKLDQSILGTADYLAPEQAVNSAEVDIRADIYSLGASLYFLLAGRPMFPDGKTAQKLMSQQLRDAPPIRSLAPDVSPRLAAVVHKCLEKLPAARFSTPLELAEALAACVPQGVPPPDAQWFTVRASGGSSPSTRLQYRRPAAEAGLPPPSGKTAASSSHLFHMPPQRSSQSSRPTMSNSSNDTPRRVAPMQGSALVSHVYLPESELDREHPPRPSRADAARTAAMLWFAAGATLTLVAVAAALLFR